MRGKGFRVLIEGTKCGITPAYAGKRQRKRLQVCNRKDHPRLCGEKLGAFFQAQDYEGSPPPMRGKVLVHMLLLQYHGITPAYAGKSVS